MEIIAYLYRSSLIGVLPERPHMSVRRRMTTMTITTLSGRKLNPNDHFYVPIDVSTAAQQGREVAAELRDEEVTCGPSTFSDLESGVPSRVIDGIKAANKAWECHLVHRQARALALKLEEHMVPGAERIVANLRSGQMAVVLPAIREGETALNNFKEQSTQHRPMLTGAARPQWLDS